jgi:hypothetical protein
MHADISSETLCAMARDPSLYDDKFYSILLWMLSHPGQPTFGLRSILENSRYQTLTGARGLMNSLRQARYVTMIGRDAEELELYQASPKPCFDDFGMYSADPEGER